MYTRHILAKIDIVVAFIMCNLLSLPLAKKVTNNIASQTETKM